MLPQAPTQNKRERKKKKTNDEINIPSPRGEE